VLGTKDPVDHVDILLGTKSRIDFSVGNILPFIGRPWGMNQWTPQTNNYKPNAAGSKSWWFHPEDMELYGIRCTHQPSPWINDYGNFLIVPEMGWMRSQYPNKCNTFRDTFYSPYRMDTVVDTHCDGKGNCLTLNLTGTERGAIIKLTFPPYNPSMQTTGWDQTRRVRLLLGSNLTDAINAVASPASITGFTQANSGGVPHNLKTDVRQQQQQGGDTCMETSQTVKNVGYSGNDLYRFQVNITDDMEAAANECKAQCCADDGCRAWTLDFPKSSMMASSSSAPPLSDRFNCSDAFPCCWIKTLAMYNGGSSSHFSGYKKGFGPESVETKFHHYFHLETEPPIAMKAGIKQNVSDNMYDQGLEAFLEFDPATVSEITIRVATSFISPEQAKLNLDRELPKTKSFEDVAKESRQRWNEVLSAIKVEKPSRNEDPKDKERLDLFYSSMYRASIFPRSLAEIAENGSLVHYSPYDSMGRTFPGEIMTDSGFWDAYRTLYQLTALVHPDQYHKSIRGWLNAYKEQGWLPGWPSPGERGAMASTMQDCVIADAILRGDVLQDEDDVQLAYEAIRKNAFTVTPIGSKKGRAGLGDYIKYGYLPEDGDNQNQVAGTLNFMLADYSIAMAAQKLGKKEDAAALFKRAANWRLLFDQTATGGSFGVPGFLKAKFKNGSFVTDFDVFAWGGSNGEYTEASGYQYRFYVPHDPQGLAQEYGGGEVMCRALEEMMTMPATFHLGYWGLHHEQVEMARNCFGQYEHNNQPVHHVLYMAKGAGCPSLGQKWLRTTVDTAYGYKTGFSGDEDNGEMASWFVLTALGLYQLVPGSDYYEIGSPLFEEATLHLAANATLSILAKGNTASTPYVERVEFNGQPLTDLRVKYADLLKGGVLNFTMTSDAEAAERFYQGRNKRLQP